MTHRCSDNPPCSIAPSQPPPQLDCGGGLVQAPKDSHCLVLHQAESSSESSVRAVLAAAPTCFFPYSRIAYGDDYYRRPHRSSWPSPRRGRGIRARSPGWCLPTCILGLGLNVSTSGLLRGGPMSRKLIYVWYACVFLGARIDRM